MIKASDLPQHLRERLGIKAKSKYKAQPTIVDGIRFASKREARRYSELVQMQRAGQVVYFLRQVPFHLPGGIIYRADFVVFYPNNSHDVEDVKGVRTKEYLMKKRLVESSYPVKIREVQ